MSGGKERGLLRASSYPLGNSSRCALEVSLEVRCRLLALRGCFPRLVAERTASRLPACAGETLRG
eukprot:5538801-Alexandrium_andersonii.AAC.1